MFKIARIPQGIRRERNILFVEARDDCRTRKHCKKRKVGRCSVLCMYYSSSTSLYALLFIVKSQVAQMQGLLQLVMGIVRYRILHQFMPF